MLSSRFAGFRLVPLAVFALSMAPTESRAQSCVAPAFGAPVVTGTGAGEPRNMSLGDFTRDGFLDLAVLNVSSKEVSILRGAVGGFVLDVVLPPYPSAADVAGADFNRDGWPDVVVAGDANDRVFVSLSDGSGGFLTAFGVTVGKTPTSLATGDFNRDGKLDIAVTANGDNEVWVLLGNGVGDFPTNQVSTMPPARQMVAADVDRDGILDVVTTFETNDELVVALGLGDGKFLAPTGFLGGGSQPNGLALGDFDRDGALDAVVVYESSSDLEFFRNDGSGSFFPTGPIPIGGGTYGRVAAGDLNRDGLLDLVVPDKASKDVNVFIGDGTGGFSGPTVITADTEGFDSSIADFDRDGRNDFAVSHLNTSQVGLFSNGFGLPCPNPSFGELGRLVSVGSNPVAIAPGDFNRDGNLDFVAANQVGNSLTRYLGTGIGEFVTPATIPTVGSTPVSIAWGDFDSDGDLDLVTANQGSSALRVFTNSGGSFPTSTPVTLVGPPAHVVASDVSGDGKIDLVVTLTTNNVFVLKNNGAGGFPSATGYIAGSNPRAVAVGDLNNDGLPDLAVSDSLESRIYLFRNIGAGDFASEPFYTISGAATAVKTAFMNAGVNLDLVVTRGTGAAARIETHLGTGAFGFVLGTSQIVGGGAGGPHGLDLADFNQDGRVDALMAAQEVNRVRIFFGNGAGNFSGTRSEMTPVAPSAVAAGDYNRDGLPDIVAGQGTTSQVIAFMGEKQITGQTFYSPDFLPANTDARGLTAGDFNRDGRPDLAVANAGNDSLSYFRGNGDGTFNTALTFSTLPSTRPRWLSAGDFDKDGKLDLVASAEGTSELVFLQGDGAGNFGLPLPSPMSGTTPYINRPADFDFDGNLDIVVLAGTLVEVYRGDGFGGFTFHTDLSLGGAGSGLIVADFNRDGLVDIAGAQTTDDAVMVFYGIDPGSWSVPTQINPGRDPGDFDAADFDGNGFLDLVIPVQGDDQVRLALADGGGGFVLPPSIATGASPPAARALDWNGDGNQDVVVASRGGHVLDFHPGDGIGGLGSFVARPPGIRLPTWLAIGDFDMDSMPDVAAVPDAPAGGNNPGILVAINSNCDMRQLRFVTDVSTCDLPGFPFSTQPRIELLDDGENPLQCELGPLTASIVPGTGGGGFLFGNTVVAQPPPTAIVSYFNLGVTAGGGGYQLQFAHATGLKRRSRTFSQGLSPIITGPAAVCQGATAVYDGGPGYEMYSWFLDGVPKSMARTVDLTASLTPGTRRIDLDVVRDTCLATTFLDVVVTANLSSVAVTPSSTITVCANCTGPSATATPTGGGAVAYQWGYRTVSGGPITGFAGETASTYAVEGMDFPGPGNYFLVVTATPACGSPRVSNEVPIVVTSAVAPDPVVAFTALSTSGQNFLEWSHPGAGCSVRILRRDDGTFPNDPNDTVGNHWVGGNDFPCSASGKDAFPDTGLTNTTKYTYSAFVYDGFNFSVRRTVTGRPFDNSGKVKWAFSTGFTAMAQVGIRVRAGESSLYVVSNDSRVYALVGGPTGSPGHWLTNAKPYPMGGPSQVRPPVVPFLVGTATNGAAFVTSQDGNVYALDGDDLDPVWTAPAGEQLLGSATGLFNGFVAGAPNKMFVGTKNTVATNAFRAFDVETGGPSWSFDNSALQGGSGIPPGMILGGSSVDYSTKRAFFGSRYNGAGTKTIWAIDVSGATPMHVWSQDIGQVDSSPVLLPGSPQRLVVGTNVGTVHLLDADTSGISVWTAPYPTGDGNVKGFVFPHAHGAFQYFMFSTLSKVTSIRHNGTGTNPSVHWQVSTIPSPSTPLFLPGTLDAVVGGGNGRIFRINRVDTTTPTVTFQQLGDGLSAIGPPSFDIVNDLIYVGSDEGVIYALERLFP